MKLKPKAKSKHGTLLKKTDSLTHLRKLENMISRAMYKQVLSAMTEVWPDYDNTCSLVLTEICTQWTETSIREQ